MFVGSSSPLTLSLGDGCDITLDAEDVTHVSSFAASLASGQVKTKLTKFLNRKQMSKQDSLTVAETLSSGYHAFTKSDDKVRKYAWCL